MIRLKYLRQEKGLSQRALRDRSKVGVFYIANAETGRFKPYDKQLEALAAALEWKGKPSDLLEEVEVR
ncbi:MAG: helix-turn-helix transcriptional regulator [Alistipes sp.]|nr:helix-turn-helix transcriptional regulator [Eggerthellaceae bacterium]MBQ9137563.1 helix-turn-helix transcriptional regulator [Alistipes sp.]MBQ9137570.1 helix-turn-helix transcriptional regulator [Alistipes sp.]